MVDSSAIPRIQGDMDALAAHAGQISDFGTAFADTGARVHTSWQGLAAVYAAPEAGQLLTATAPVAHLSAAVGEDHQIVGRVLSSYATEVREIQARLDMLRAEAVVFETSVAADGADDTLLRAVNQAVADFQEAERRCANAINALYDGPRYRAHDGDGRREPGEYGYPAQHPAPGSQRLGVHPAVLAFLLAAVAGMLARTSTLPSPPGDGSPEQNAAWWASLTAGMQQVLLVTSPGVLGSLAGLPAWVRDRGNRSRLHGEASRLDAEIARLLAELAPHRGAPGFESGYYHELRRLEQLQAKRASIEAIESTLARGDRQLLLLDLSGDRAEAAVAIGNVDTADHVAVFTPGFTTTVDGGLAAYDEQMDQLRREAEWLAYQQGYGVEVATVTWIGYQAPQWAGVLSPSESVLSRTSAEHGAEDLTEFYRGVNATRSDDPHLTAIGHSYGSTTTGLAVQQPGTGVDDVVFLGSPGVGTSDIDDVRVPEGHTYVVEARRDLIADVSHFGADPNCMAGVTGLSAREESIDGRELAESTGHPSGDANGYLANGTTSQYNISVVVAGMPEKAVHDRGIGVGDWLW